jgi:hypothetical protein
MEKDENWVINSNNIIDLAYHVVAATKDSLRHDNKDGYRADIPLFKAQLDTEKQSMDLNSILHILRNTTQGIHLKNDTYKDKETCLYNILKFSKSDSSIIIEVDAKYKDDLQPLYQDLLKAIKRYDPSFKNYNTSINNLKAFDMTPYIKNNNNFVQDAIERKVTKFTEKLSNEIPEERNR